MPSAGLGRQPLSDEVHLERARPLAVVTSWRCAMLGRRLSLECCPGTDPVRAHGPLLNRAPHRGLIRAALTGWNGNYHAASSPPGLRQTVRARRGRKWRDTRSASADRRRTRGMGWRCGSRNEHPIRSQRTPVLLCATQFLDLSRLAARCRVAAIDRTFNSGALSGLSSSSCSRPTLVPMPRPEPRTRLTFAVGDQRQQRQILERHRPAVDDITHCVANCLCCCQGISFGV